MTPQRLREIRHAVLAAFELVLLVGLIILLCYGR
jgi:hypothetical protein